MLDIRTIVVMLVVSAVLMTVTLAVGGRQARSRGLASWNIGLGLYATGWLLVAMRGALPDVASLALADALLLAGLCCQLAAVRAYGGKPLPGWFVWLPGPLLFGALVPAMPDYAIFTLVATAAYVAVLLAIAFAAARLGIDGGGSARWMLAVVYAVGAALMLARTATILVVPQAQPDVFSGGLLDQVAFVALFAITVTGSLAFMLMLREHAEAELRHLAMFDPLTELFNRRAFFDLAARELARVERNRLPYALLMLDLDRFKRVNDDYGHQAGDRVLADFADALRSCLRAGDLAGRYGGEEFCVMLAGADAAQALAVAERIRAAACERPLGGIPRATTVSIGASLSAGGDGRSLDAGLARADEALYQAKQAGRNRVLALGAPPALRLATA